MALDNIDVAAEAAKIAKALRKIFTNMKGVHGGFKDVWKKAPAVVAEVEKVAGAWQGITGEDKKAMAVEALLLLIPLPKWLPTFFARAVISWAIEAALKEIKKIKTKRKYPPK